MAVVVFSTGQRDWVDGLERVEVEAARIADLIEALYERFPALRGKLDRAAAAIDGHIHNDPRYLPLQPDSEVHFMGAVAGGSGDAVAHAPASYAPGEPLELARSWHRAGRGVALATVIETWGSSPNPAGSQLAIDDQGRFEGSVSGGCVEGAVIAQAREVIASGEPALLEFGVADEEAWAVGLACGGRVRIRVERIG